MESFLSGARACHFNCYNILSPKGNLTIMSRGGFMRQASSCWLSNSHQGNSKNSLGYKNNYNNYISTMQQPHIWFRKGKVRGKRKICNWTWLYLIKTISNFLITVYIDVHINSIHRMRMYHIIEITLLHHRILHSGS